MGCGASNKFQKRSGLEQTFTFWARIDNKHFSFRLTRRRALQVLDNIPHDLFFKWIIEVDNDITIRDIIFSRIAADDNNSRHSDNLKIAVGDCDKIVRKLYADNLLEA